MDILMIIFLLALFANVYFSIQQRKKYPYPEKVEFSTVPDPFKIELKRSIDDGYKLSLVSDDGIYLI